MGRPQLGFPRLFLERELGIIMCRDDTPTLGTVRLDQLAQIGNHDLHATPVHSLLESMVKWDTPPGVADAAVM
jgi:hypothetical protein